MNTCVSLHIHHHGKFTELPKCDYIGGWVDVIEKYDTDLSCFRDLDDWAK